MGVLGLMSGLFFLIAMAASRFQKWKFPLGATLLTSAGVTSFSILNYICIQFSPEMLKMMPVADPIIPNDYIFGGITTISLLILGIILVRSTPKEHAPS
ncbi:MAG: hypothetical protein WCD70_06095 [Alphaproteobacteria bacterium]